MFPETKSIRSPPPICQDSLESPVQMDTTKIKPSDDILSIWAFFFFFGKNMPRNRSDAQRSISLYHPQSRNALNGIKTCFMLYMFNAIFLRSSGDLSSYHSPIYFSSNPNPNDYLTSWNKIQILQYCPPDTS